MRLPAGRGISRLMQRALMLACLLTSCAHDDDTGLDGGLPDVELGDGPAIDVSPSDAPPRHCSAETPLECAYAPRERGRPTPPVLVDLSYTDVAGLSRAFQIAVHLPDEAPRPLPVVVYSHGGAHGVSNATGVGAEWADVFVRAGYAVVAIAHPARSDASWTALCDALGYDTAGCAQFKWLSWDRPNDFRRTLDWIDEQAAGRYAGVIDPAHLAYAGHSAGAGSVLMAAGAAREYAGAPVELSDPRPIAFMACSPEGPGMDGFVPSSFEGVRGRLLILSGEGDDTELLSEARRQVFDLVRPGGARLGWILEVGARHTTYEYKTDACIRQAAEAGIEPARCDVYLEWLRSVALAHFDAELRGSAAARAYLDSDAPVVLSGGAMEWLRR